jgi:mannan endo-1,4-beta-mannosidase
MKPFRISMTVAAATVLTAAACSASPTAAPPITSPAAQPSVSAPLGTNGAPRSGVFETNSAADFGLVREFAAKTGAAPAIVESYAGWWTPFNTALAADEHAIDATPLIQLDPQGISLAVIAAGRYDAYLRSYAASVRAFGHPIILSFGHEMNGTWYGWGKGRTKPAVFIAAWRHIVDVFRAAGASNVTWLWTVNAVNAASAPLYQWWPGAAYVNWVGIDGYYYYPSDTFGSVFGSTATQIRQFASLPILIAETAVGNTADRETQIRGLFAGVKADRLAGLVWFDANQSDPPYHQRWRLESDPAALTAFRAGIRVFG